MQNTPPLPQDDANRVEIRQARDEWERETNPLYMGEYACPEPFDLSELDPPQGEAVAPE